MSVDEDLAFMMADESLTVPVVYGAVTTRGYLDLRDDFVADPSGGQVLASREVLTIQTSAIPAIADDTNITIDGNIRRVRTTQRSGDGKTLEVDLA